MSAIPFLRIEVAPLPRDGERHRWAVWFLSWTGHWAELRRRSDGARFLPSRRSALLVARGWARVLRHGRHDLPIWLEGKPYA